jgi:hypothetical protein
MRHDAACGEDAGLGQLARRLLLSLGSQGSLGSLGSLGSQGMSAGVVAVDAPLICRHTAVL